MVRTLVVSSATLAILFVCFFLYESTQLDPPAAASAQGKAQSRQETTATAEQSPTGGAQPSLATGRAVVGPGERIQMTFYPRKGNRARVELSVVSWTPVEGTANRFLLNEPDIRMRTSDGHAVRITAKKGSLDARRKPGGGLDPNRGSLAGDVVILYDRLTEAERAARSSPDQSDIPPAELVRIELDEMEFDLEYSKVIVPGPIRLTAGDVSMQTGDLEVRFDESTDRVEELRIGQGGRLELIEGSGFSIPTLGAGDKRQRRIPFVQWLRTSVLAMTEAPTEPQVKQKPTPTSAVVRVTPEGVPVFGPGARVKEDQTPPIRYLARFVGGIDMTQRSGQSLRASLKADVLEIVRAVSGEDRTQVAPATEGASADNPQRPVDRDRLVLAWKERLLIQPCTADDPRCAGEARSTMTATGTPVDLSLPEGKARCARLRFMPDGSRVWLYGTPTMAAVAEFAGQGTLRGRVIQSQRRGDDLLVHVDGPGKLVRGRTEDGKRTARSSAVDRGVTSIAFGDSLDAYGRFVTRTTIDARARIISSEERVLDRAVFRETVRMRDGDSALEADVLTLTFAASRGWGTVRQSIERAAANGHVTMTNGADRLTCRELNTSFSVNVDGQSVPTTAVALGDVVALQGQRTIQARDKLIVDFRTIKRSARSARSGSPTDNRTAKAAASTATNHRLGKVDAAQGVRPDASDREPPSGRNGRHGVLTARMVNSDDDTDGIAGGGDLAARGVPNVKNRAELGIKRFRAFGRVTVADAAEALRVEAEEVDCAIARGGEIQRALITGLNDRPASVRLRASAVTGRTIKLDLPTESVEVPGAGRLTFVSRRDLDGRAVQDPIPIAITWRQRMEYHGSVNRAVFHGTVHATSATNSTFDCDRLDVEFDEVATAQEAGDPATPDARDVSTRPAEPTTTDWWVFQSVLDRVTPGAGADRRRHRGGVFSKTPAVILATGHAIALTSNVDPDTGKPKSRARIAGPKLWVNLRPEVSKMQIEGPGTLLLEDNRPFASTRTVPAKRPVGLFGADQASGPSNTLIQWDELMWYDFSTQQTLFRGHVHLKHFSGAELLRLHGATTVSAALPKGRATFLDAEVLKVDFVDRSRHGDRPGQRSMGELGMDKLKQFEALRSVVLQDESEGLHVLADRVVYRNDSDMLAIFGTEDRKARITTQKPGELPSQVSVKRLFYNLRTGTLAASATDLNAH